MAQSNPKERYVKVQLSRVRTKVIYEMSYFLLFWSQLSLSQFDITGDVMLPLSHWHHPLKPRNSVHMHGCAPQTQRSPSTCPLKVIHAHLVLYAWTRHLILRIPGRHYPSRLHRKSDNSSMKVSERQHLALILHLRIGYSYQFIHRSYL